MSVIGDFVESRNLRAFGWRFANWRSNVRKAFEVPPEKAMLIKGRNILLIDDVRTTGATLAACAEVLKQAGAAQVNVLSFALVLEPHRFHIDI